MNNVLLAEATEELSLLAAELERAGLRVETCALGEAAERLASEPADALVVNVSDRPELLPELQELLQRGALPARTAVLLLVQREDVAGLDPTLAVDDFAVVPATGEELAARLRRAAWRRRGAEDTQLLQCGEVAIDQASYKVSVRNRPVELTYKEYELLRFLMLNQGKVCTRETLLSRVWGYDFYGGARTVDVHIRRLRSKIEDGTQALIETVRNVGYRFRG